MFEKKQQFVCKSLNWKLKIFFFKKKWQTRHKCTVSIKRAQISRKKIFVVKRAALWDKIKIFYRSVVDQRRNRNILLACATVQIANVLLLVRAKWIIIYNFNSSEKNRKEKKNYKRKKPRKSKNGKYCTINQRSRITGYKIWSSRQ